MPLRRAKSSLISFACAVALSSSGCMAPWSTPFSRNDKPLNSNAIGDSPATAARLPATTSAADAGSDMSGVMEKIEQVRALDPAAEPQLLEQLRHVPPNT